MNGKPYFNFDDPASITKDFGYGMYKVSRCPVCGNQFRHSPEHVYRAGDNPCCSWTCHRRFEKAEEEKEKIVSEADYAKMKKRMTFAEMKIEQAEKVKTSPAWETMTKGQRAHVNSTRRMYKNLWNNLQEKVLNAEALMRVKQ